MAKNMLKISRGINIQCHMYFGPYGDIEFEKKCFNWIKLCAQIIIKQNCFEIV